MRSGFDREGWRLDIEQYDIGAPACPNLKI